MSKDTNKTIKKKEQKKVAKDTSNNKNVAVIETGGKQYLVSEGTIIDVEKIDIKKDSSINFDKVLMISQGDEVYIGTPYLNTAKINGKVINPLFKSKKKIVFKFKPKTGYKLTQGHRQSYTTIKIDSISVSKTTNKAKSVEKGSDTDNKNANKSVANTNNQKTELTDSDKQTKETENSN